MRRCSLLRLRRGWRSCSTSGAATRGAGDGVATGGSIDFSGLEAKWQERWEREAADAAPSTSSRPPFYMLPMFPYPSGNLHMGHVRVYTLSDCLARFYRMRGFDVLHPIGWDAFGLPAENAAFERDVEPQAWTEQNIAQMRAQLGDLGMSFDWGRELRTCDPEYYRWTQWLFLKLHAKGLVYRKNSPVFWDPVDKTVLANEQVDSEGRSWRSGAVAETRDLTQWYIRTTALADALDDGLGELSGRWPEEVLRMQRSWIGRSEGATLRFSVAVDGAVAAEPLVVFTTRPETVAGVTFVAVSPDHPLARGGNDGVLAEEEERALAGVVATNPITGAAVPVYVADHVVADVGTGVVMGVPAHDERDASFAARHGIPARRVLKPSDGAAAVEATAAAATAPDGEPVWSGRDGSVVNSGAELTGLGIAEAAARVVELARASDAGDRTTRYRLRDWLVSRQRYWGAPVPMVHCDSCGAVPVPLDELPVALPPMDPQSLRPGSSSGDGEEESTLSPLARAPEEWRITPCPSCGGDAERDADTLDTFVDSSWYYLRYTDPKWNGGEEPWREGAVDRWMKDGVDLYIGGIEHATMHLLYARFIGHFLADEGLIPQSAREPFHRVLAQGMVLGRTYRDPEDGRILRPEELDAAEEVGGGGAAEGVQRVKSSGDLVHSTWEKMSKSKYNGIAPGDIVERFGADVTRLATLFKAPPQRPLEWSDASAGGQFRWLHRVWRLVDGVNVKVSAVTTESDATASAGDVRVMRQVDSAIERVSGAVHESRAFNVAIAELMKLSNVLGEEHAADAADARVLGAGTRALLLMLAPLAPHAGAEMWEKSVAALNDNSSGSNNTLWSGDVAAFAGDAECADVHAQAWPEVGGVAFLEANAVVSAEASGATEEMTVAVQVSGKFRGTLSVASAAAESDEALEAAVRASSIGARYLDGKATRRAVVVRKKDGTLLCNVVV